MGLDIKFIGLATINHLNIRSQGNDDQKIIAIDVSLSGMVSARALMPVVGVDAEEDIIDSFWCYNQEGGEYSPKLLGVEQITTWGIFDNHQLRIGRHSAYATVKKIKFKPQANLESDVSLVATIDNPDDALINHLVDHIKDDVQAEIKAPPELDLTPGAAA